MREKSLAYAGLFLYILSGTCPLWTLRDPQLSTKSLERQRKNATFYTHRTGENMRTASRSSISR